MLTEHSEQTCVLVLLQCSDIWSLRLCLTSREAQLTTTLCVCTQVELCDVYVLHYLLEAHDGLLQLSLVGEVDVVMPLHADTVDGHARILHLLHHIIDTLALTLVYTAVVVVDKDTCGISLTGKLEGLCDELITTELEVLALAIWVSESCKTVIGHCLVHYVPGIDYILIAVDDSVDMLAQTLVEHLLLHRLALLVGKHPVGKL